MKKSRKSLIILNLLAVLLMGVLPDFASAVTIAEFPLPLPFSVPAGIAAGPDGNVWFTEQSGNNIGQITPTGFITEFEVPPNPTVFDVPLGITNGPNGNLWFTESFASSIGQITTSGIVSDILIPTFSQPFLITNGPDGNLWFTEESYANDIGLIGRITTAGVITEFPVPTANSQPFGITTGPDGNLWFTEATGNNIGQITTAGVITEFPVPTAGSQPAGITNGPDGNLWFTEATGNNIGQITTAGVITEFPVPTAASQPLGITTGPDANLWFTEGNGNNIGLAMINSGTIPVPTTQLSFVQSSVVTPVISTVTYSISGTVTSGGNALTGVTMTLGGAASATTATDTSGNYSFAGLANATYTVTPSLTGNTFSPTSITVTVNNGDITGQNFTGTANTTATFSISGTATAQPVSIISIRPTATVRASSLASMENSSILAPIGIGPVAAGGSILTTMVGLGKFSGPVDIYFAFFAPAIDPVNIYILTPSGFQPLANAGLVPWVPNTIGGLYETLIQDVPVSQIPSGTYTFYLAVTPAGNIDSFYLWQTSFTR
jgi:streptogramin lyase